jgi:hypothetical protein
MTKTLFSLAGMLLFAGSAAAQTTDAAAGGTTGHDMAIVASFNGTGNFDHARVLKALSGGNYLDLALSLDYSNTNPDGPGSSISTFSLGATAGYRMYKEMNGRIHPYISPYLGLGVTDDDAMGNPKLLEAGGLLGVDFLLLDQFTLGAAVGAALRYTIFEDRNVLNFNLFTTWINATFWWG